MYVCVCICMLICIYIKYGLLKDIPIWTPKELVLQKELLYSMIRGAYCNHDHKDVPIWTLYYTFLDGKLSNIIGILHQSSIYPDPTSQPVMYHLPSLLYDFQ